MYGTSGPSELGYASAAILTALLDKLIQKSVISRPDATEVLDSAIAEMRPFAHSEGVARAIRLIEQSIVPKISK